MLSLPPSVRIFLAREPVDCRKAFDGLCALVRDQFGDDPFSGHLFAFFNKRRDRVKILVWDKNGFWLFAKREMFAINRSRPSSSAPLSMMIFAGTMTLPRSSVRFSLAAK